MSYVTKQEKITTHFMTPLLDGGYREDSEAANAWRCEGCGLVWDKRHFAEGCEARGHKARWMAGPYGVKAIVNGQPVGDIRYYPREALRRDNLSQSDPE